VSVNEETEDPAKTPGRAAIVSTLLLVVTYVLVTLSAQSFAGVGGSGIGLGNPDNSGDVLSVLGSAVFGSSGFGSVLSHLLILMVLSSAAASTQTTILPTARTTLAMSVHGAIPKIFSRMHGRFKVPTVSTVLMGAISVVLYTAMNYMSGGQVIADAVTAIGVYIAFYYGLTGITCAWAYRRTLFRTPRDLFLQGVLPVLGGAIMWFAGGWALWQGWDVASDNSYTTWLMPVPPHWRIGGVFMIVFAAAFVGLIAIIAWRFVSPPYFRGETLLDIVVTDDLDIVELPDTPGGLLNPAS
jgi:amino acid transporter